MSTPPPTDILKFIQNNLSYNRKTGKMVWKNTVGPNAQAKSKAGSIFGKPPNVQYYRVYTSSKLTGKRVAFFVHHAAWFLVKGKWPEFIIDHKDGDGLNNRWKNFRPATNSQNSQNKKTRRTSKTGVNGVSQISNGKFVARLTVNQKVIALGCFNTLDAAKRARVEAEKKYHLEFASHLREKNHD